MDQSTEMSSSDMSAIRNQMDETRSALTEKLEKLEQKVTDTVQGAAQSVGDTVENVKHAVEDTVHNVTSSVRDTVHAVGEAFSISHHVERHPWAMVAGATAVGFVGGYLLMHKSSDARAAQRFRHLAASQGQVPVSNYDSPSHFMPQSPPPRSVTPPPAHDSHNGGRMNAFQEWLKPAASQVQGLAVGAALGLVRDMLLRSVPKPMSGQVTELVDGLTQSLGGQVMRGSLLDQFPKSPRTT